MVVVREVAARWRWGSELGAPRGAARCVTCLLYIGVGLGHPEVQGVSACTEADATEPLKGFCSTLIENHHSRISLVGAVGNLCYCITNVVYIL